MSQPPKYVARFARLPQVFERLAREPDGVPLTALAEEFDTTADELREDLLAFYTAEDVHLLGLSRPDVLEFLGPDGREDEPNRAEVVRMVAQAPSELGVEYVDAGELGLVYAAALALLDTEPDNADLGAAIDVLAETMFGESSGVPDVRAWNRLLPTLRQACDLGRAVRIVYSRAWVQGVTDREIEPYRLVQTRRGWEVDAGPPDEDGRLRTFLLSNIRTAEVLERTFEAPDDVTARLAAQRATTTVKVVVPQAARWAADFYAERVVVQEDDEEMAGLVLELLPPVEERVGLLLLAAGPDAFVVSPPELESAGVVVAETLLVHHAVVPGS